jgi:DNA polymerase-1
MDCSEIVLDFRLDGKHPSRSTIVSMCIGCSSEDVTYIPLGHSDGGAQDSAEMLELLRPLLESETPTKVVHNAKPALEALWAAGMELRGLAFDTMIAAFLLESGQRSADLGTLAFSQLNVQLPTPSSLLGTGRTARKFLDVPVVEAAPFCCDESRVVHQLVPIQRNELTNAGLSGLFTDVELPL